MSSRDDAETSRRDYRAPYTSKHPIPTISGYKDLKEKQRSNLEDQGTPVNSHEGDGDTQAEGHAGAHETSNSDGHDGAASAQELEKTSQEESTATDPKQRRQDMKHRKVNRAQREVTDPVTHLRVTIRDFTDGDLEEIEEGNNASLVQDSAIAERDRKLGETSTLEDATQFQQRKHSELEALFPPTSIQEVRDNMTVEAKRAVQTSTALVVAVCVFTFWGWSTMLDRFENKAWVSGRSVAMLFVAGVALVLCVGVSFGLQFWMQKKLETVWEDEVWHARNKKEDERSGKKEHETSKWFNNLIGSLWPLINPDLFTSLGDTLEDVMQASLPRMVRMISIEDMGQGSDSIRILGIKWLPKGAANRSVNQDGQVQEDEAKDGKDKRKSNANNEPKHTADADADEDGNHRSSRAEDEQGQDGGQQKHPNVAAGMEPEEGDFVNLEVAFAYKATASEHFRDKAKHAHLYLAFYLPGGIKLPIWVELRGLIGTIRARMQITPDPPFVALCTITFLGQPRVDLSCVPLVKHGLNIMDLPLISNFVQSAVDAAMSEYVAPKSLTLDLKAMLSGDDFKRDTSARGVVMVKIIRGYDFKAADMAIPGIRKGSSDPYVSIGWAKFGKALWSSRVLVDEMEPYWEERAYILVGPEELDAEESLRLQLWDSDRMTADDDLGRIEIPLKYLMKNEHSNGRMWNRCDTFQALTAGETMPGRLEWSVGYFTKSRIMDYQVANASGDSDIKTVEQLRQKSFSQSKKKLREASKNESAEIEQLQTQDYEDAEIQIISDSLPSEDYPSGILSIQIHQIVGLELQSMNRGRGLDGPEREISEEESSQSMPDSYCTIILNHNRIYRTRTKPKNSQPFFNACTERFIRDWRTTSVYISVRDARLHEDDPLIGIVHLPIASILRSHNASYFNALFPLTGGVGFGRVRVSCCFRSVQLQLTPEHLGWDYGTIEVSPEASWVGPCPAELRGYKLRFTTMLGRGKMHADSSDDGRWTAPHERPIFLPVSSRYRSNMMIEFRHRGSALLNKNKVPAFAILWLHSIPDQDEQDLELDVWKGDEGILARARVNVLPGEQCGEKVGVLRVKLRFWRGIGRWHEGLAGRSEHVAGMMEVLDAADDEGLVDTVVGDEEWIRRRKEGEVVGLGEVEDTDSEEEDVRYEREYGGGEVDGEGSGSGGDDGEGGVDGTPAGELRQYRRDKTALHRKQRGLMQFKAVRTAGWMKGKGSSLKAKVEGKLHHRERVAGMETEV